MRGKKASHIGHMGSLFDKAARDEAGKIGIDITDSGHYVGAMQTLPAPGEVRFKLTSDEFLRAHRFHLRKNLFNAKTVILLTFALMIASLQAQVLGPSSGLRILFFGFWVLCVLGLIAAFLFLPGYILRKRPYSLEEHRLEWTSDGLALLDPQNRRENLQWKEVHRILQSDGFYLLYSGAGPSLPWILPQRAWRDLKTAQNFVEWVIEESSRAQSPKKA